MTAEAAENDFRPDIDELILFSDPQYVGDTYIFEPSSEEGKLGYLFAAAETENRDGMGKELLDTALQAAQREYYRDPSRGILPSFESALHQANLILHDITEQGMRDWMGYFHVALGVLAGSTLHISTAGHASVLLIRRSRVSVVSTGLSHSPITDPLRTFSQVASGVVTKHDLLLFTTSHFEHLFRHEDVARFAITHSATTITLRLKQLYEDQAEQSPVALLTICILPNRAVRARTEGRLAGWGAARTPITKQTSLTPRQPLVVHHSIIRYLLVLLGRLAVSLARLITGALWPAVKRRGQRGGATLLHMSHAAGSGLRRLTRRTSAPRAVSSAPTTSYASSEQSQPPAASWIRFSPKKLGLGGLQSLPRRVGTTLAIRWRALPLSSKIFAVLTFLLAIALVVSFILLHVKRTEDAQFSHASELLHEAQTKKDAAEAALIYDNRDQARKLLGEAQKLNEELATLGLYQDQNRELASSLAAVGDRLEKVLRITGEAARVVGDFSTALGEGQPSNLFFVAGRLYTFNPTNNTIATLEDNGTAKAVSKTSQGVGYLRGGVAHEADKVLILITNEPGIALFDTKTNLLQKQELSLPSNNADIQMVAPFGSRLYLYDRTTHNIYNYNKTLRGFSGGTPWITDTAVPRDTISSIAIDGFIYTLHDDGTIRKLYKGAATEFVQEKVEPPLQKSDRLFTAEHLQNLYVLDRDGHRVVIFTKKGTLKRQIFLENTATLADIAVNADETILYVLDGTQVRALSLTE